MVFFGVCPACHISRRCKSSTRLTARSVSQRQGRNREVGSEGSWWQNPAPTNRNRILRLLAVGKFALQNEAPKLSRTVSSKCGGEMGGKIYGLPGEV